MKWLSTELKVILGFVIVVGAILTGCSDDDDDSRSESSASVIATLPASGGYIAAGLQRPFSQDPR